MATYFAYIDHYKVFTEFPLNEQFERVARLASLAPRMLREAHAAEENMGQARGINRATWTVWGGQYGMAERGGPEQEECDWPTSENPCLGANEDESNGWEVPRRACYRSLLASVAADRAAIDTRPAPLTADQG